MTDQQRFDQLGFTSGGYFDTPNLDVLAAGGVVFDAAYSGDTVCVPARNALLTGMLPHRLPTQENGFALREGCWTIARALRDAGYQTALVGKMHFAPVHAWHGFDTMRMCEHLHVQELGPISAARDDCVDDYHEWLVGNGYEDWRFVDGKPVQSSPGAYRFPYAADAHPTNWIEREARAVLDARDPSRPLLLVVSFPHPHAPVQPSGAVLHDVRARGLTAPGFRRRSERGTADGVPARRRDVARANG